MVLSLLVWLFVRVELTIWQAAGVVVGLLLLLVLFAGLTKRFGTALLVIVALWIAAGVQSFILAGFPGLLVTSFLPFAAVAVGVWTWRALALASGIPFLLPVALVVVFLPLLTQDLWVLGDEIGAHLASLALVALAPSLLFLALRYLRIDVHLQLASALERLRESPDLSDELLSTIKAVPREPAEDPPPDDWMWQQLSDAYKGEGAAESLRVIGEDLKRSFHRQTIYRLVRLSVGAGALFGGFVYLLAWAAIPTSTSARWIGHSVGMTQIELAGRTFELPVSPYVSVSALLSIVATAALIAFALTEDRYSNALSTVLVERPAERCVLLGLAFRSL